MTSFTFTARSTCALVSTVPFERTSLCRRQRIGKTLAAS